MKIRAVKPEYIKHFPEQLEEGIFYISEEFQLTAHKCCCGCGEDVYNKLSPVRWSLSKSDDGSISLYPSIGNWNYACQSHYWIRNNQVIAARPFSTQEIELVQKQDRHDRDRYIELLNVKNRIIVRIWKFILNSLLRILQEIKELLFRNKSK